MKRTGLKISDKPDLLKAQESGIMRLTIRGFTYSVGYAIAKIEEMERKPLTWNDAINAMSAAATVEKKADFAVEKNLCMVHVFSCGWCNEKYRYSNNERFNGIRYDCLQCWIDKLNSPYDGAKDQPASAGEGAE